MPTPTHASVQRPHHRLPIEFEGLRWCHAHDLHLHFGGDGRLGGVELSRRRHIALFPYMLQLRIQRGEGRTGVVQTTGALPRIPAPLPLDGRRQLPVGGCPMVAIQASL